MKIAKIILALLSLPLGAFALDPPIKPIDTVYVSNESDFEHEYSYEGCWTQDESTVYILKKT